jgi:hypothetical protein
MAKLGQGLITAAPLAIVEDSEQVELTQSVIARVLDITQRAPHFHGEAMGAPRRWYRPCSMSGRRCGALPACWHADRCDYWHVALQRCAVRRKRLAHIWPRAPGPLHAH